MSIPAVLGTTAAVAGTALHVAAGAGLLSTILEVGGTAVLGYLLGACTNSPTGELRNRICRFIPRSLQRLMVQQVPLYDARGDFVGNFRMPKNVAEQHSDAYWRGPARFRILFDNFPVGYALCRIGEPLEVGRDFLMVSANRALTTLLGLTAAHSAQSVAVLFPALLRTQPALFELVGTLPAKGTSTYSAWFPYWGKYLEHRFVWLGDDYFAMAVSDVTDNHLHQAEVLKLHGQMGHQLSWQATRIEMLARTTDIFLQNVAAYLEAPVDGLAEFFAEHDASLVSAAETEYLAKMHELLRIMLRYSHVASLNYRPELVQTPGIVDEVLTIIRPRYPAITFKLGPLPMTTCSASVLHATLLGVLDTLCRVAGRPVGTSIEIGVRSEFLEAHYYVRIINPAPVELSDCEAGGHVLTDPLSALQMSVSRRLVYYHGGTMTLTAEEDGSLLLSVTLGEPLSMLQRDSRAT